MSNSIVIRYSTIKTVKVGDYLKFGNYPQSADGQVQPIEWQILEKKGNKILVISRYGLEARCFDSYLNNWKNSEIRKWLNGDFYNKAFTDQEKKSINPFNLSDVGTSDNVFLLSKAEAEKYFANDDARRCKATDYAVKNGAWVDSDKGSCYAYSLWWLRSAIPNFSNCAFSVGSYGDVNCSHVNDGFSLARPALWINL